MSRHRDKRLNIRVTETERDFIIKNMQQNGLRNVTDFFIECIIKHKTVVINTMPLLAVKNELNKIGVNINQIAKIANTTRNVDNATLLSLQKSIDEMRTIVNKAFTKEAEDGIHENRTDKNGNAP